MSILLDRHTRVCVQGITGLRGRFRTERMLEYGTRVVAGVTPGKGGQEVHGVPVFNGVDEAVRESGAEMSVMFVPAPRAKEAIFEAIEGGIKTIICVTEFVPLHDAILIKERVRRSGVRLFGPNASGLIVPGKAMVGYYCDAVCAAGDIGVATKSGTLGYAVLLELKRRGLGESVVIGVGGDPIKGTTFLDCLEILGEDPETRAILLIGEIGGSDEEKAAEYIAGNGKKPVAAFVAGRTVPPGETVGHAGAMIVGSKGSYDSKVRALRDAGARVATVIDEIPDLLLA